jgi:Rad3-related DNA helicase
LASKPSIAPKYKALTNLAENLGLVNVSLRSRPEMFFVEGTSELLKVMPLTPKPFFDSLTKKLAHKRVITSATIGDVATFAAILGIDDYEFVDVPSNFTHTQMPVWLSRQAPRISYKSGISARKKQIDLFERVLKRFPKDSLSLLHTASIAEAEEVAQELKSRGYGQRVWLPSKESSTEQKIEEWRGACKRNSGTIAISWCFHTGIDAPDVAINIVLKVPYKALDGYWKAILETSKSFYGWLAGTSVEQACGRIRRGEPKHYEESGQPMRKFVGIFDNNFTMVKRYTSQHFRDCLVYMEDKGI